MASDRTPFSRMSPRVIIATTEAALSATDGAHRPAPSSEKKEDRKWPQQDPEPMQGPIASVMAHRRIVALNPTSIDWSLHNARFVYPAVYPGAFFDTAQSEKNQ